VEFASSAKITSDVPESRHKNDLYEGKGKGKAVPLQGWTVP
jgi:hypothetical protein